MAGYPHNASLMNARLNGIGHLPEGMSDVEKQRQQQLARQAALTRRAAAGGLTAAQIQTMKQQQQQQQMYAQQQQHMQQAALQAGQHSQQGPQPGQPAESGVDGRSEHSPPPPQSGSPSKRQRLSPDGAYSQVAPNRFVNAAGQQANAQAAHQMLLNTGMNPGQMNQQFNAQMMQLKQQQAAAAAQQQQAQHLQQQAQQGHLQQQPGLSQAAMQAQQLQQYSSNLMNNHRALLNMSKGQGAAGPGLQPGAPHIPGGSPMIAHSSSDQGHPAMYVADAYGQNPAAGQLRIPPGTQQSVGGNTNALQDYQMQLMLLEQQNKRRLMVARQEQQDAVIKQPPSGAPGGPPPGQQPGQPGQGQQPGESMTPFPAMSPQQGRLVPSPQPTMDMAKRATPKIANQAIPGSPLPDSQQHPAGHGQQPNSRNASPNMAGGFSGMDQFNVLVGGPGGNNLIMRGVQPSHPSGFNAPHLQQISADQGGPRPQGIPGRQQANANLIWTQQQGQQMMPGQNQPGPQQGGQQSATGQHPNSQQGHTPQPQSRQQQQQQQQMPPPQAPSSAPRASASPSMASTPITAPTPPAAKILPKGKKEPREPKKRTKKQQAAAAAAAAAAAGNQPVTPSATPGPTSEPPTPTTPITPQHPNSFSNGNAGSAGSSMSGGANPLLLKATTFSASQNVANNTNNVANAPGNSSTPSASSAPAPQTSEAPSSFLDADAPSLFPEFGTGADGDIGDLEFDINTFLNTDDATAGGLNFDPTSAFTWNESVEATGDV
ncbi:hypothetical protein V1517DRAFT_354284 [Lipomyces orientalis]|uniref:Uncharacterized protein n=1 Tax=Lipomyces orientalis TaxID=1233043 RepID=A0ACC3TKP7_9ASCO